MAKLRLDDISDLRAYEREREQFRREVIELKKLRRIAIGPVMTVVFENRVTIRFQVQEMARAERMATDEAIEEELRTYNPLIPDPGELSLTVFLELTSPEQLRVWLPRLVGVERSLVLRIGEGNDASLVRAEVEAEHESQLTRDEVTAAVHYVRFSLDELLRRRFASERAWLVVDHPAYRHETELPEATRRSVVEDWADSAS